MKQVLRNYSGAVSNIRKGTVPEKIVLPAAAQAHLSPDGRRVALVLVTDKMPRWLAQGHPQHSVKQLSLLVMRPFEHAPCPSQHFECCAVKLNWMHSLHVVVAWGEDGACVSTLCGLGGDAAVYQRFSCESGRELARLELRSQHGAEHLFSAGGRYLAVSHTNSSTVLDMWEGGRVIAEHANLHALDHWHAPGPWLTARYRIGPAWDSVKVFNPLNGQIIWDLRQGGVEQQAFVKALCPNGQHAFIGYQGLGNETCNVATLVNIRTDFSRTLNLEGDGIFSPDSTR